jgi:hypothetical protein
VWHVVLKTPPLSSRASELPGYCPIGIPRHQDKDDGGDGFTAIRYHCDLC